MERDFIPLCSLRLRPQLVKLTQMATATMQAETKCRLLGKEDNLTELLVDLKLASDMKQGQSLNSVNTTLCDETTQEDYELFLERVRNGSARPTIKKLFLYKHNKWNVEQEIWFWDKNNPSAKTHGNFCKEYCVLHVHHHAHQDEVSKISLDSDLKLVNAANIRALASKEMFTAYWELSRKTEIKDTLLKKIIMDTPYANTLISARKLPIFPRNNIPRICVECGQNDFLSSSKRCVQIKKCGRFRPTWNCTLCSSRNAGNKNICAGLDCPGIPPDWTCVDAESGGKPCSHLNQGLFEKCEGVLQCNAEYQQPRWNWNENPELDENLAHLLNVSKETEFWSNSDSQRTRGLIAGAGVCAELGEKNFEAAIQKSKKIQALCIGIDHYACDSTGASWKLANCCNDAQLFSDRLQTLDANIVLVTDCRGKGDKTTRAALLESFTCFQNALKGARGAEIVIFYIAAHAFQVDNDIHLLPSDFDFDCLRDAEMMKMRALPLQILIKMVQHSLAELSKSFSVPKPARLFLLDCCRDAPKNHDWRLRSPTDAIQCFDQNNGRMVFSCFPGQSSPDGDIAMRNSPFARILTDEIFREDKTVEEAIHGIVGNLKVDCRGSIHPKLSLRASNRINLRIESDISPVASMLAAAVGSHTSKSSDPPDILSRTEARWQANTDDEQCARSESTDTDEGVCVAQNINPISLWQEKMKQLIEAMKRGASERIYPVLLMYSFMRSALTEEEDHTYRFETCKENQGKGLKDPEPLASFESFVYKADLSRLKPQLREIIVEARKFSTDIAVKYVLNEYFKQIIHPLPQSEIWKRKLDDLVHAAVPDYKFLEEMSDILDRCVSFDNIRERAFAYPGSFTAFFKISRIEMLLLHELLLMCPEIFVAVHDAGFRYFISSFPGFGSISASRNIVIPQESRLLIYSCISNIAQLSNFEWKLVQSTLEHERLVSESSGAEVLHSNSVPSLEECPEDASNLASESAAGKGIGTECQHGARSERPSGRGAASVLAITA